MSALVLQMQNGKPLLQPLEKILVASPLVTRILGENPGPFTLRGTNTYLIGKGKRRLLWDTGDGRQEYLDNLLAAMKMVGCESLQAIIVSHYHSDHLGGVPMVHEHFQNVQGVDIPVYKYMPEHVEVAIRGEGSKLPYEIWPKERFLPIQDGQIFETEGATLKMFYTPGHANDHMVGLLKEENSMFSADNVLGEGTGVFSHFGQYLDSLQKMYDIKPSLLYPAHGPIIEDGQQRILEYIEHRMERVRQVEQALQELEGSSPSGVDLPSITRTVYPKDLPENLFNPAMNNTRQVLAYLEQQHVVTGHNEEEERWRLTPTRKTKL